MSIAVAILVSLISVVNPLGAVPVFLSLTPHYETHERNRTSLLTSLYFIIILMAFFWAGSYILGFFGVSIFSLKIAGGLVIMMSGFALLNGKFAERRVDKKVREEALEKEDISFSPMAMPMLSGPGSISLLIAYFNQYTELTNRLIISGVIIVTGIVVYMTLRFSPLLFRVLGAGGLKAVSRIMGFIVLAIGIQYIIQGVVALVTSLT